MPDRIVQNNTDADNDNTQWSGESYVIRMVLPKNTNDKNNDTPETDS